MNCQKNISTNRLLKKILVLMDCQKKVDNNELQTTMSVLIG
jgi:hypothetical protein